MANKSLIHGLIKRLRGKNAGQWVKTAVSPKRLSELKGRFRTVDSIKGLGFKAGAEESLSKSAQKLVDSANKARSTGSTADSVKTGIAKLQKKLSSAKYSAAQKKTIKTEIANLKKVFKLK